MLCVWCVQRGHDGVVYVVGAMLFRYDLRKGDLPVLSCASVLRVECGSVRSEVSISGGVEFSILLCVLDE